MNKKHSYHAFASRKYRLLSCVIFPAACLLLHGIFLGLLQFSLTGAITLLSGWYFILADMWVFGGSCSKTSAWTGYLQSSAYGEMHLRKSLIRDCALRFCVMAFLVGLCTAGEWYFLSFRHGIPMYAWKMILQALKNLFMAYAASTLIIIISRHFTQMMWYYVFASWGMLLYALFSGLGQDGAALILATLLSAACAILFSVISIQFVIKKLRRSYYDKTVEI